ncbi:MAG: hypothetical protein IPJ81_15650 [Chitinophagaceae bacterium]|nr:hypothetical protein [Chitinophagaceae bacterium]
MGFFDKIKTFVGADAPTITFTKIEDQLPVTDTVLKYNILVTSEKELTAMNVKGVLTAIYKNEDGAETQVILASDIDNGDDWNPEQNPFPGKITKDKNWEYGGMVMMNDDKSTLLQQLFANKTKSPLKIMLTVTLDIKETGMLFDPSIKREITIF